MEDSCTTQPLVRLICALQKFRMPELQDCSVTMLDHILCMARRYAGTNDAKVLFKRRRSEATRDSNSGLHAHTPAATNTAGTISSKYTASMSNHSNRQYPICASPSVSAESPPTSPISAHWCDCVSGSGSIKRRTVSTRSGNFEIPEPAARRQPPTFRHKLWLQTTDAAPHQKYSKL